jgi:prevent-host-death family protein
MSVQQQRTEQRNSTDVQTHWDEVLGEVCRDGTRVVIERDGAPVAALISAEDLRRFQEIERERAQQFEALFASWEAFKDVPVGDVEAEVAQVVAEVRAERQARGR